MARDRGMTSLGRAARGSAMPVAAGGPKTGENGTSGAPGTGRSLVILSGGKRRGESERGDL